MLNSNWNATTFFEEIVAVNNLAQQENFVFCRVSGLEGFEEALHQMQTAGALVCVSDIADGYTELNNTPRTRRVKTVFLAMRHAVDDMAARSECMETMRELFRQFMSRLTLERVKLEQNYIYIDPRISFTEIDRYFFNGGACAYFQIAVDCYTDLSFNSNEWSDEFDPDEPQLAKSYEVWLISYDTEYKYKTIIAIRDYCTGSLKEALELVNSCPCAIKTIERRSDYTNNIKPIFDELNAVTELRSLK